MAVRISYGTGDIVGYKVQDTVRFGGAEIKPLGLCHFRSCS